MATIYKRGNTYWGHFQFKGHRHRFSTGERDRKAAQKAADLREEEIKLREKYDGTIPLMEASARFFMVKSLKEKTRSNYETSLMFLLEFLGNRSLGTITSQDLEKYAYSRVQSGSKIAPRRDLAFLSSLFSTARGWPDGPKISPFTTFKLRDLPNAEAREVWLTEEDIQSLLKVCNESYQKLFILLAVDTGMRLTEMLNLTWREVDLKQGLIYLGNLDRNRTKGGRGRVIPLTKRVRDTLSDTTQNHWVFENPKTHRPYTTLKTFWARATTQAGLSGVRIHDLRHTYASLSLQAGVDTPTLMKIMGHKTDAMLRRYAHPSMESIRHAVEKLERHK